MSDRSTSSGHSLCSKGPVVDLGISSKPKSCKKAANWSAEDTTTLLEFLLEELPKIGDGNFKRSTWTAAASLISTKHKITKGGG
ncbi:hypothetical protein SCLCIDRAFT_130785 [Scleroderma citrinum Foug A]|uniref:Myb/SANT-like domain-containing protein n=1 Tax=Scleroderma citrinum Foug A TaxID=1036808 RepID=A0A0C3D972_9AGAM|nr:hypothetical protein SCLCIDRAFT_130785 [Scleroderma citrinum Foug A]